MRESHPYRRVSESENAACNLPVTSLKSHCSIVIHHLGGLVAFRGWKQASFQQSSRSSVPQFPATAWMSQASLTLFSVTFTLFFFSLQLCVSSNLQHFPATSSSSPPALRSPCWISCGLHCTPAPPSSPFFLSSWRPYPEYSMMAVHLFPPVSCLCMSLSVPIVPLLTCACTVSPHSSFLLPFFYVAHTGLRLSPHFCQACFSRSPLPLPFTLHFIYKTSYFSL